MAKIFQLSSFKITILYLVLGFLWIHFSDQAVMTTFETQEFQHTAQNWKGWMFVSVTGILLFFLIERFRHQFGKENDRIMAQLLKCKEILDRSDQCVCLTDINGNIRYMNRLGQNLSGLNEPDLDKKDITAEQCFGETAAGAISKAKDNPGKKVKDTILLQVDNKETEFTLIIYNYEQHPNLKGYLLTFTRK